MNGRETGCGEKGSTAGTNKSRLWSWRRVPRQKLGRWAAAVRSTGSALSDHTPPGRSPALDEEQKDIFAGWVLHRIDKHSPIHLADAVAMVSKRFGVVLSQSAAGSDLQDLVFLVAMFDRELLRDAVFSRESLLSTAQTWLNSLPVDSQLRRIVCFDATATSRRRDDRAFRPPGTTPQRTRSTTIPSHTDHLFEGLWADGTNRTPALLFTHNPKFDLSRSGRAKWSSDRHHLLRVLADHRIDQSRIIYEHSDKHYYAASADMVRVFFGRYRAEFGTTSSRRSCTTIFLPTTATCTRLRRAHGGRHCR